MGLKVWIFGEIGKGWGNFFLGEGGFRTGRTCPTSPTSPTGLTGLNGLRGSGWLEGGDWYGGRGDAGLILRCIQ